MKCSYVVPGSVIRGKPNPKHHTLAKRLKSAREGAEIKSSHLEVAAGVSNATVRAIEEQGRIPGIDVVERLARVVHISPGWLAYGTEGPDIPLPVEGAPLLCASMGERLRTLRQERGLSLRALAEAAELTAGGVGSIETGRTLPSVATAEQLAKALGISPAWLAYGEGPQVLPRPPRRRKSIKSPQAERRRRRLARGGRNQKYAATILRGGG